MTVAGSASGFRDSAPVTQSADIGGPTGMGHRRWNPHVGNSIQPEMKGEVLVCKTRDMVKTNAKTGRAVELICSCDIVQKIGGKHRKASATNTLVPGKIGETHETMNDQSDHKRWECKKKDRKESNSCGTESDHRIANKIGMSKAESIQKDGVKEIVMTEVIHGTTMNDMLPSGTEWQGKVHL